MAYFLYTVFFISCIVLIVSVLLQPGKTDAGALFTSNISSSAFNPRGTQTILAKISITAAVVFMLSALFLSMPALTGNVSVLQTAPDAPTEQAPALSTDANANTAVDANANVDANTNANAAVDPNLATKDSSQSNANAAAANPAASESDSEPAANANK